MVANEDKQIEPQSQTKITGPATKVRFCLKCRKPVGYCYCQNTCEADVIAYDGAA